MVRARRWNYVFPSMNHHISIQDIPSPEQLELFDIVPDRPLPPPAFGGDPGAEPLVEWLRGQSEENLRTLLQILESTPGFRRP